MASGNSASVAGGIIPTWLCATNTDATHGLCRRPCGRQCQTRRSCRRWEPSLQLLSFAMQLLPASLPPCLPASCLTIPFLPRFAPKPPFLSHIFSGLLRGKSYAPDCVGSTKYLLQRSRSPRLHSPRSISNWRLAQVLELHRHIKAQLETLSAPASPRLADEA